MGGTTGLDPRITIVDVLDDASFDLIPPCADPSFDHRSCDYWEDPTRGSKAARSAWLVPVVPTEPPPGSADRVAQPSNPFLADALRRPGPPRNPFAPAQAGDLTGPAAVANPFLTGDDGDETGSNPFAPRRTAGPAVPDGSRPKLRLLSRGLAVAGSYARVLLLDGRPAAYCQFGPLTAYPRAQRTRDLYPILPDAPLPAVITCIATNIEARDRGLAQVLVRGVCAELSERGFAAVETYPEVGARTEATSAATPEFWVAAGFHVAADDQRFPVMRLEFA